MKPAYGNLDRTIRPREFFEEIQCRPIPRRPILIGAARLRFDAPESRSSANQSPANPC